MQHFLSACRRIEEIAGKIYQQFSNDGAYSNEVQKVFRQLSDDEKAHARHIDLVLQANAHEIKATRTISGEKINEVVTHAERLFRQVEAESPNEEKALRMAVKMEQQFVDVHVQNALNFDNRNLTELFDRLGKEDETHLNTLRDCLTWWQEQRSQAMKGN